MSLVSVVYFQGVQYWQNKFERERETHAQTHIHTEENKQNKMLTVLESRWKSILEEMLGKLVNYL